MKGDNELKRVLSMLLTVALVAGLLPIFQSQTAYAATGTYFIFPNERYDMASPKVVNTERVEIKGSLNRVNGSSISYSVYQLQKGSGAVIEKNEGQVGNISVVNSEITVSNVKLYPGLNKITFKGTFGSSPAEDSIYIEYRNGPTLYDVKASLAGVAVEMNDTSEAILVAQPNTAAYLKSNADIIVSGKAPSADKVTISVGSKSWTYNVSSYNNYEFTASLINVKQGKNLITIKVFNGDQAVETTREVTFYNGSTTFYDLKLEQGTTVSPDLSTSPDFGVNSTAGIVMSGKAIVPILDADANTDGVLDNTEIDNYITYNLSGGAIATNQKVTLVSNVAGPGYHTIEFTLPVPAAATIDQLVQAKFTAGSGTTFSNYDVFFTLRNMSAPYIHDIRYLDGYNSSTTDADAYAMTGSSMKGKTTNIFALPTAFEVLVANGDLSTTITANTGVTVSRLTPSSGVEMMNINGVMTPVQRIVVKLTKLNSEGAQTITLTLGNGKSMSVDVVMMYGPYVQFDAMHDGQIIYVDTTIPASVAQKKLDDLKNLKGSMFNVADDSTIVYSGTNQSVYLYINNTVIPLEQDGSSRTDFILSPGSNNALNNALVIGSNTVKFVYKTSKNSYEKIYKVNVLPTNVPEIPVENTLGIIPFKFVDFNDKAPLKSDPLFTATDKTYSTKEKKMNIFGTFDFIDLGTNLSNVQPQLDLIGSQGKLNDYILKITSSQNSTPQLWTLGDLLLSSDGSTRFNTSSTYSGPLSVYYHPDGQYFSFILRGQDIPLDGTPVVYNITVYNAGESGPSASSRLEVVQETTPFNIIRPLPEKRIVNQNFVEVIVDSEFATKVMVGKQEAEKIEYDSDYNGVPDYMFAHRAIVKDLKPNKDTKIDISVTVGNDTVKDTITVRYVPTNIPGAQVMDEMSSSHKVFDGALTLTFPKGTNLVRRDFNVADQLKTQVFSGHDLLFAIGNSTDGVIDRHEFEINFTDYNNLVNSGKGWFSSDFPARFSKASPVFWIDPGTADQIGTQEYDPLTYGVDPYQFESLRSSGIRSFYDRIPEDELIPSKQGKLVLSYDAKMSQDGGRLVTVFRFDPENKGWENIGGVVDAKKHTITVPFDRFGYYVVAKLAYSYNDIIDHSYGRDFIETIYAKGVMNPADQSNQFGVDNYVSRGEFTRMVVRAQQLPLNYGNGALHFGDIGAGTVNLNALWDYRYIETAARAGIVKGISPQAFEPGQPISRQDAAVIIAKALNLKLETDRAKVTKDLQKYFKDYASINYYAQPSVLAIAKKGFIAGSPVDPKDLSRGYMFNPTAFTLRGDAAIIMSRVMISEKKLPKM